MSNKNNSSSLAKYVRGMDIKKVVDDKEWQTVRVWLKGKWAKRGAECTQALKDYLYKDKNDPYRVRRVLNYVTCSGFRTGAIKEPTAYVFREDVRSIWRELLGD